MTEQFDPVQYKINSKLNWNTVAHDYHNNWADTHEGPFKSTFEIVKMAQIQQDDKVLDLACGTGVVSREILQYLKLDGLLIGIDLSRIALSIAKKSTQNTSAEFIEMDAENVAFNILFDKVLCQYGLMFFPDVGKVLKTLRKILKKGGKVVFAVHGLPNEVPYFSSMMSPIQKYIPNIRPEGAPTVHRFGDREVLINEIAKAGFYDISIKKFNFSHRAGTFEEYWQDYLHSTANSIRPRIESQGNEIISKIKDEAMQNVSTYTRNEKIIFPWTVLISSAFN